MRKLILILIISLFAVGTTFSKDLFTEKTTENRSYGHIEINNPEAKFLRVTDQEIDTISVNELFPVVGFSLICFSENWCPPSYREFNTLYNDSIIDFLKNNDTRLIVLAGDYPFIKVNQLDSLARDNIEADFEIYYNANRFERYTGSFPQLWLIDSRKRIVFHSNGVQKDYSGLKKNIMNYEHHYICHRCNGTGRVRPSRYGGPDEAVGICPLCGGHGRR